MKLISVIKLAIFAVPLSLALLSAGCSSGGPPPGLKGIQGQVTIQGEPAPAGVRLEFQLANESFSFTVRTKADGSYKYLPLAEAPLKTGVYRVAILPPAAKTVVSDAGVAMSEKPSGPKNYGKYSNSQTSGIQATLNDEVVTLDIDLES
ncbi:hydroxyisourate hydrolase [Blastopirellula sp. J2-11]|uniref:hydroxyisourate hydrolase n=1 Tax=Blastopirellula sp. J2-11 TaxID=2943192 RepID=UPI0021CACBDF|nr:hydroxyisourate hydrolase [Blastopirellula sp. J2-11]UUO05943.1 hydroxyisourate hydrolase [Blastopirellula sp. J2-11]